MGVKNNQNKTEQTKISTLLEDLASLESYARDLFSFLPIPVCFISSIGIVLEANPAFGNFSNYEIEEIVGEPTDKFFNPEAIEEISRETFEKSFIKGKEIDLVTKQGKEIPTIVSTVLRKSEEGEIIGYFIALFDLTEIKKTERGIRNAQTALLNMLEDINEEREKTEEEKNKTLAMITNLTDGLLVFDKENKLLLVNPQAQNFLNLEIKKVINKSTSELNEILVFKPLIELFGREIKKIFRQELSLGKKFVLEITTAPFMVDEEKIGTLVIIHDVSREKLVEKMKTEFVSLAAHQLRTPLSAIKWTLKMLLDGDLGKITSEQKEFIDKTYISNERMINLINDLLDVTRIEEGRYLYKPTPTDIEAIVQFVINSYKDEIEKRKIKLDFKKSEKKLPHVRVDVEKIKLAIQNLIDNAIRYNPAGGKVIINLKQSDDGIEFSVKDSGIGIPKEQQARIFTKFFRALNATRIDTEGSGLGLYITKNIVEAHGGEIWFKSKENEGSTFYFNLPITPPREKFEEFIKKF